MPWNRAAKSLPPGSPLDPRARGANRLIKDGATLIESAQDILSVLAPTLGGTFQEPDSLSPIPVTEALEAEADRIRTKVEEALGPAPVEIDELIRQLGAPVAAVLTVILELELAGRCQRHPGNRVSWC
jgi:DNA processing protein